MTPGRSIAVDRLHEYGTPFFIEADLPIESVKPAPPFRRLMIAQDTGSAIVGPARADLYLGAGEDAGRIAGRIHHPGRFVMLLPRELDLIAAGRQMPLPVPKPKIAEIEVAKRDGKGRAVAANVGATVAGSQMPSPASKDLTTEGRKPDGNGKAVSANVGEVAAGRQMPSRASKAKDLETEGRKQDGRGKAASAGGGAMAAGKQMPQPASKATNPEIAVRKQHGKRKTVSANSNENGKVAARAGRQAASARRNTESLY